MKKSCIAFAACLFFSAPAWASEPSCQSITSIENTQTPIDLTVSMVTCVREQRYDDAVDLFNVAGVFAKFDTLRVPDKTAHQAYSVLKMQAAQALSENEAQTFDAHLKNTLSKDGYHPTLCQAVKKIGAPTYKPTYMTNHGMAAFTGKSDIEPGTPFDEKRAWGDVLETYLKCPK